MTAHRWLTYKAYFRNSASTENIHEFINTLQNEKKGQAKIVGCLYV